MDVITENARRGVVNELLHANDLVLMTKDIEDLKERFWNWKDTLESKGLKVKSWPIQCCAQNVETELMANMQK